MGERRDSELYPRVMVEILKEREIPPFRLRKKTIPKGTVLDHYIPGEGRIIKAKFSEDFPIVVLEEDGDVWMSDTPFEIEGISNAVELARGKVLTSGLGIGIFPSLAAIKPNVKRVDIVERERKVIDLVYPQIWMPKLNVIQDDLYHFLQTTRRRYDFIYLDIWKDHIGPIEEADRAVEAARRCLRPGGEVRVWLQELIDRVKDALPRAPMTITGEVNFYPPCLICGKTFRNDYGGLCMDCADIMGVSEIFIRKKE